MSRTDASRFTDAATVAHPAVRPIAASPGSDDTSDLDNPGESALAKGSSPTRPVTRDGRRGPATRTGTHQSSRPLTSESMQLSAGMTATLTSELDGRVARDLIADIVRAVVDESRQTAPGRAVGSMMAEARQRLERFIRAASTR